MIKPTVSLQEVRCGMTLRQTIIERGAYESAFKFPQLWKGRSRIGQGQNRIREIRPSGIVGGPAET